MPLIEIILHFTKDMLLYKKLVLKFLAKYNRNTTGYCSNNDREQKKI